MTRYQSNRRGFKLPRFLYPDEVTHLLETAAARPLNQFAFIATLAYTGLRRNEARMLNLRDINLEEMTVLVRHGKGRKERMVPLHPDLAVILASLLETHTIPLEGNGPLFLSRLGQRAATDTVRKWLRFTTDAAGMDPRISPHWLRHSLGFRLVRQNTNIRVIQQIFGHSELSSTMIYTAVDMSMMREALESF